MSKNSENLRKIINLLENIDNSNKTVFEILKENGLEHIVNEVLNAGDVYTRVVWKKLNQYTLNDPEDLSVPDSSKLKNILYAIHVGDPHFWFKMLIDDYGREPVAWVLDVKADEGDVIVDDYQYAIKDNERHGSDDSAAILITKRKIITLGKDFEFGETLKDESSNDENKFWKIVRQNIKKSKNSLSYIEDEKELWEFIKENYGDFMDQSYFEKYEGPFSEMPEQVTDIYNELF